MSKESAVAIPEGARLCIIWTVVNRTGAHLADVHVRPRSNEREWLERAMIHHGQYNWQHA